MIPISPLRIKRMLLLMAVGIRATIPAKMIREIPLPMPRSVICSPSHMMKAVPAVRVIMVIKRKDHPGSRTTASPAGPVILSKPNADSEPLDEAQEHRSVAGVLGDLLPSGLPFLRKPLQMGNHDREQLKDDRGTDIGHDPQGENGQALESAPGEHVDEAEESPLGLGEEGGQGVRVDPRRGDVDPDAIDGQEQKSDEDPLLQLWNFGNVLESLEQGLDDLRFPSGRFDLLLRGKAEPVGSNR